MKICASLALLATTLSFAALTLAADTAGSWIDIPFVAQSKNGCGSAVISMVMQYWAKQVKQQAPEASDPQKIQQLLFVPAQKGIPASAMLNYFQRNGYRTFAFRGEWSDLLHHISQGRPLIVSLKASAPLGPLHYAVVAGVDWDRNYIFLNDPARGEMLRISREGFLQEWSAANNWTLLALPVAGD